MLCTLMCCALWCLLHWCVAQCNVLCIVMSCALWCVMHCNVSCIVTPCALKSSFLALTFLLSVCSSVRVSLSANCLLVRSSFGLSLSTAEDHWAARTAETLQGGSWTYPYFHTVEPQFQRRGCFGREMRSSRKKIKRRKTEGWGREEKEGDEDDSI